MQSLLYGEPFDCGKDRRFREHPPAGRQHPLAARQYKRTTRMGRGRRSVMSVAENKRVISAFYEAGNQGDMERCLALLAEEVTWTNIGSTKYSGRFEGKQALIENLLGRVFGQLEAGIFSTIENIIAEGDFVVVQSRGEARTTSGRPYDNQYCHVFRLQEGQILEVTEYLDTQLVNDVLA
jgi:uncharacterized protein